MGEVPGGFTRLLAFARRELGDSVTRWLTFSDRCVSDGGLYARSGFEMTGTLRPDYRYLGTATDWKRVPKERFQLKRFKTDPNLVYEEGWTESEAARANGLTRVWDAGKVRWERNA